MARQSGTSLIKLVIFGAAFAILMWGIVYLWTKSL